MQTIISLLSFLISTNYLLASNRTNTYTLTHEEQSYLNILSEKESEYWVKKLSENPNNPNLLMIISASQNKNHLQDFLNFLTKAIKIPQNKLHSYLNQQDKIGNTAQHYSINRKKPTKSIKTNRLLTQYGVDEDIKNNEGNSWIFLLSPKTQFYDIKLSPESKPQRYEIHIDRNFFNVYTNADDNRRGKIYHAQLTYNNRKKLLFFLTSMILPNKRPKTTELVFFLDGKKLNTPQNIIKATLNFLLKGQEHDEYNCSGFLHSVFGVEWTPGTINLNKLNVKNYSIPSISKLTPGTGVLLMNSSNLIIKHCAIYLADNVFISKYGKLYGLAFSSLEEMQNIYASEPENVMIITPKSNDYKHF